MDFPVRQLEERGRGADAVAGQALRAQHRIGECQRERRVVRAFGLLFARRPVFDLLHRRQLPLGLAGSAWFWVWPHWGELPWVAAIGATSLSAHYAMGRALGLGDASFVRLREAWITLDLGGLLPGSTARESQLIISGRNLVTWTDWFGVDPESGASTGPSVRSSEWAAIPLARSMTVRLRMAW